MKRMVLTFTLAALLLVMTANAVAAETPISGDTVVMATAYLSVITDQGSALSFPIELTNPTAKWQSIRLSVDGPAEWNPSFKSGGFSVRQVMIAPSKSQTVNLDVKAPKDAKAQEYAFDVKATNQDNIAIPGLHLTVLVQPKASTTGLRITTDYPNLRGQADSSFSFTLTVANNADQDRTVNFDTTVPQDWQVTIKPSYQSTQVSSISLRANATQNIDVAVTPPRTAPAGEYPVVVKASAGSDTAEMPLKIVIVGKPSITLNTASGQLNAQAAVDAPAKMGLVVRNDGTQPLQNVSLSASTPDGWQVTFDPAKIDNLPPNQTAQVNATIQPGNRALAGDYMVTITGSAGSVSDRKDIRVTVETPTTWGWAAVGAIAIVVAGLGFVFWRYNRR